MLSVFVALEIGSRRVIHFNATEHPTAEWTLQQLRGALPGDREYRFLLHDRYKSFSSALDEEVANWGIEVLKFPVHTPTANGFCERLIGTIRRECLDYVIPLSASHLKRTLREWVEHYNARSPHQSLGPGIPDQVKQKVQANEERETVSKARQIMAKSILVGLHHEYRWVDVA